MIKIKKTLWELSLLEIVTARARACSFVSGRIGESLT